MMNKQERYDTLYMDLAERVSRMSHAKKKKVGSVLVKGDRIISFGWNGTPTGFDNECEDEWGDTLFHVLHSELNLIAKLAKSTESSAGSTVYCTLSPCIDCAKLLVQAGVSRVVYKEGYREDAGLQLLRQVDIEVEHLEGDEEITEKLDEIFKDKSNAAEIVREQRDGPDRIARLEETIRRLEGDVSSWRSGWVEDSKYINKLEKRLRSKGAVEDYNKNELGNLPHG
tara:strand:+ start:333 stop:1013 length:681 start_codon:yes stop_codon:yes gene_type:complete